MIDRNPLVQDFRVGDDFYQLRLTPSDDTSRVRKVGSDEVLFSVDSGGNCFDRNGKCYGVFRPDNLGFIYFKRLGDNLIISHGNKSYLKTEMKVFKELISKFTEQ